MNLLSWLVGATLLLLNANLFAFELTYTCGDLGPPCRVGESPQQVFWRKGCVPFYVNELGSVDFEGGLSKELLSVVKASFNEWNDIEESGFHTEFAGLTNIRDSGDFDGNVVAWRDDEWPYASVTALALTIITFDSDGGEILDADIEFNTLIHDFSIDEEPSLGQVDFQSTLTHEVGHFIGLDHSSEREATMFGRSPQGQSKKRTLHADDIEGYIEIYPSKKRSECGARPDFLEAPSEGGCCATYSMSKRSPGFIYFMILGLVFFRIRDRRVLESPAD